MQLARIATWFVVGWLVAGGCLAHCVSAAPNSAALPQAITTRQRTFSIPFSVPPPTQAQEPVEVQLWVSGDQGRSWQQYSVVSPHQRQFMFRAAVDGEFWFVVRTVDRSGRAQPEQLVRPGLRVIVDTELPKLELQALRGAAGQIITRWKIQDANPKPGGLKIHYRADGSRWQTVATDDPQMSSHPRTSGEITWMPPAGVQRLEVRGEATDLADNTSVSHAQVDLQAASLAAQSPANSAWRAGRPDPAQQAFPPQATAVSITRETPNQATANATPDDRYANHPANNPPYGNTPYASQPIGNRYAEQVAPQTPAGNVTAPQAGHGGYRPAAALPNATGMPTADPRPIAPGMGVAGIGASNLESGERGSSSAPMGAGSVAISLSPNAQNAASSTPSGPGFEAFGLPPGERPRMVKSRLFELDYDVSSVGSSGIARVELFGTRDGGRTWKSFALDDDNRSPILVSVDAAGIYGFRAVIQSGAGLGTPRPEPGALPEIVVGVDLTEPIARIVSAEQGTGTEAGTLTIRWTAEDLLLSAQPVSLSFSESPAGPWTAIASGLENTGQYTWRPDARVPEHIYLRLEVRDEAGNVAAVEAPEAISMDHLRPTVRIRDVRPLGEPARTGGRRYRFY